MSPRPLLFPLALCLASPPALAGNGPIARALANAGYVGDSAGVVVVTDSELCVHTASWSPALALPQCDPGFATLVEPVAPVGLALPTAQGTREIPRTEERRLTLHGGALFASGSAELSAGGRRALDELVARIRGIDTLEEIEITGHTDAQGDVDRNQKLSLRRAHSVRDYLIGQGVDASLIATAGAGESEPVADNATAEGRARNRRVEIVLRGFGRVASQ